MNVANRMLVTAFLLMLVCLAVAVIILAWSLSSESIARLSDFVSFLNDHDNNLAKLIITLGSAVVLLLGLALIILEVAPRAQRTVAVHDVQTGSAVLSTEAIARRIEQSLTEVAHVESAKAKVIGRKKGVEIDLQLLVDPDSDLAPVADEASQVARDTLAEKMSVALAKPPRVRFYYSRPRVAKPAAPEPAAPSPPPSRGRREPAATVEKEDKPEQPPAPDQPATDDSKEGA
jgi:hypothetical protein